VGMRIDVVDRSSDVKLHAHSCALTCQIPLSKSARLRRVGCIRCNVAGFDSDVL
jgi:hypothetical protein